MKSDCFYDLRVGVKSHVRYGLEFNKISINFFPSGKFGRPHLLCCPGLAVCKYSFALDASDMQPPKLLQHRRNLLVLFWALPKC
jgi:hypothetical protein